MTGASAFGNSASNWGTTGPWGADSVPWGVEGDTWTTTNGRGAPGLVDSEALIAVELCLVKGDGDSEDLRIANILFNNLDVIGEFEPQVRTVNLKNAKYPRLIFSFKLLRIYC